MVIKDTIYGQMTVKEPILLALLKTPSLLRLKKISQFGLPDKYYHLKNYSRYEHSVGVMLFLKRLGASMEEQVAGLLHDVSVLTFSHVADWVFAEGASGVEDYHNRIHERFVGQTEIPAVLEKFNFDLARVLDEANFSLLERGIPDLCADRVDYALREFKYWLAPALVKICLKEMVNYQGEIVFLGPEAAFDFAVHFLELQTRHWGGYQAVMRYHLFSQALKMALNQGILAEQDFYQDEPLVLGKLERAQDKGLKEILKALEAGDLESWRCNSSQKIVKKFRYVDPPVLAAGRLTRLSQLSTEFRDILTHYRSINDQGLVV